MKKITTFMIALGVLVMGTVMHGNMAEARYGNPGYRGEVAQSALTEDQQKKLAGLFDEHYAAMDRIDQKLVEKEAELRLVTVSEKPDAAKVTALSRDIGELRGQMYNQRRAFDEKLNAEGFGNLRGGRGYGGDCLMRGDGRGRGAGYGHGYHGRGHGMGRGYHGDGYGMRHGR